MAVEEQEDVRPGGALADVLPETVRRAAESKLSSGDEQAIADATEWLLAAVENPPEITNRLIVNVGGVGTARKEIGWVIRSLPGPTIRKIREDAERQVRRTGGDTGAGATGASFVANVRTVVEGSVSPDLKAVARRLSVADPAVPLEQALNHKQGLIDQIAGSILQLSGYDNEDVRDAVEVTAAGN